LRNYILRIYREEEGKPSEIVGIVEEVEVSGKRAFTNIEELWDILKQRREKVVGELAESKKQKGA
jgi:hypothetical protein